MASAQSEKSELTLRVVVTNTSLSTAGVGKKEKGQTESEKIQKEHGTSGD